MSASNYLLCVSLVLLTTMTQGAIIPGADQSLPVFGITIRSGEYNLPVIEGVFTKFFGGHVSVSMSTVKVQFGNPTTALFQFALTNKQSNSDTLKSKLQSGDLPALKVVFSNDELHLINLNWTMSSNGNGGDDTKSTSNWASENPEIIAGAAAGFVIIVFIIVLVVVQRRAKQHEAMRETMEAMLGEEARSRPRAPSQGVSSKGKRAPKGGAGAAPAPTQAVGRAAASPTLPVVNPQHRARLVSFYQKHNPDKLDGVDQTLVQYQGKESELFSSLVSKYGPEPTEEEQTGSAAEEQKDATAVNVEKKDDTLPLQDE